MKSKSQVPKDITEDVISKLNHQIKDLQEAMITMAEEFDLIKNQFENVIAFVAEKVDALEEKNETTSSPTQRLH